jgi:hypothetical protein
MYYRNGRGSGYASKNYPERVIELTYGYDKGTFSERKPFIYRVIRRLFSLLISILTFKFIKVFTDIALYSWCIKGEVLSFLFEYSKGEKNCN